MRHDPWYPCLMGPTEARDAVADLLAIAFELERRLAASYRVAAFRSAAAAVAAVPGSRLSALAAAGRLTDLKGVGARTAEVVAQSLAGQEPEYLRSLLDEEVAGPPVGGADLLAALRGDLHAHTDASDGGSPLQVMALAARDLGHDYLAITDHSPRLTVAHGLSRDRLLHQLDQISELNSRLAPFQVLTGIEVDILLDGSLDQDDDLLKRLDVVVASVHSKLRMPRAEMTARMLAAVSHPAVDVLGHCTGRNVTKGGRGGATRPESEFDAEAVFAACAREGVAVEINCRPERLDPPQRLLRLAVEAGCRFSIDTDAHAPGQLTWQGYGTLRAAECGVSAELVINTWPALSWKRR